MTTGPDCACCPPALPSAPSETPNPPGLAAIAYRLATQSGFKRALLDSISEYPQLRSLTTRADDDPAVALIDAWACTLDVLTFYQERIANEGFLRTATERRSVLELARAIGYELRPGVAAETQLAFTLETAAGAPASALVPAGTKVQSVPAQNQAPQTFETISAITALGRWNALRTKSTRGFFPLALGRTSLYLQGQSARVQVGDVLLIVGTERANDPTSDRWDLRRVVAVRSVAPPDGSPNGAAGYTVVRIDRGLGSAIPGQMPAQTGPRIFVLRARANLFGYNAADWRTMPLGVRGAYLGLDSSLAANATDEATYPEWPGFDAASLSDPPPLSSAARGLRGAYYAGENFEELRIERIDPAISFTLGAGWPPSPTPKTMFSARWEGWLATGAGGAYTFTTDTDDGARLWVNGELVVNSWIPQDGLTPHTSAPVILDGGRQYPIRLEYFQEGGGALAKLSWTPPNGALGVIPTANLYPADIYTLKLDALYPKVTLNSWLVLANPGYTELYSVSAVGESGVANFALSAKVTWVSLAGENLYERFNRHLRDTIVFGDPEEFAWADAPDGTLLSGSTLALTTLEPGLLPGQRLAITGLVPGPTASPTAVERLRNGDWLDVLTVAADGSSATVHFSLTAADLALPPAAVADFDQTIPLTAASEVVTVQGVSTSGGVTVVWLRETLANPYLPQTVRINANVAAASHGDSRQMRVQPEALGSGDGSATFQSFVLKQSPVTFVSAATPTGVASTVKITVDGVKWSEARSFYEALPTDRVYTLRLADDSTVAVRFGDGLTGARLPTGVENVQATYRVGIGTLGNLNAGQLTLLLSPALGLKSVVNPIAAAGGTDPERLSEARRNAPLTVLTLERIVSLGDFRSFAAAFAGIGKAQAVWVWDGVQRVVAVTVAATDGAALPDSLLANLQDAMDQARPPHQALSIVRGTLTRLPLTARLKVDDAYDFGAVRQAVSVALLDSFGFPNRDFGQPISASQLVAVIQAVAGVTYVVLDSFGTGADASDLTGDPVGAQSAGWSGTAVVPAELLLLDPAQLVLTEITA